MDFLKIQSCPLCDEPMIRSSRTPLDGKGNAICVSCYTKLVSRSAERLQPRPASGLQRILGPELLGSLSFSSQLRLNSRSNA